MSRPEKVSLDKPNINNIDDKHDVWVRVRIEAELLEDTHPGSGSGGGGIDALVARDRRGKPVIWASHLEGVLRDAALRLHGQNVANDFFGRAGGQRQRAVFTSLYTKSTPATRIWRSTARDSSEIIDNRAPKDDTLRVVEHVPKGTRFEGKVELPARDLPLLHQLLNEVDALGRGRATGAGRVKLSVSVIAASPRKVESATGRLVLLLRNLDPLCITATATPDNLIPSLAFIPGRALLGALASWLIAGGRQNAAALLVNGSVSVSDALPVPPITGSLSTAEVLPAPLSLQSEKPAGSAGAVPWWAKAPVPAKRLDSGSPGAREFKLKRPEGDLFVFRASPTEPWASLRPTMQVRLRNGRPDPTQADPSLFAIEQIAEDTSFFGEIRGSQEDMGRLAADLKPILNGCRWLRIGRAGAAVEVARMEWGKDLPPTTPASRAILTLTSDLLVRDEKLRWCTTLEEGTLPQLLGWPKDVRLKPVVQEGVAVHGFNGTSRLWRMPASGIRRGSVFEVEEKGIAALSGMIAEGRWLGERTHEGFGRFRLDKTLPGITDGTQASSSMEPTSSDDLEDAIAVTTRRWFKEHSGLARQGSLSDRKPSLSQWLDLVAELERNRHDALISRQNPATAGGRSWRHSDARAILDELAAIQETAARIAHARLFVRWLRAEIRRSKV